MENLFGKIEEGASFSLFHDESGCDKSNFLYHGFLFIKNDNGKKVLNDLVNIKKDNNKERREIHFHELNQHPQSPHGAKTRVALGWLNLVKKCLEGGKIKFYLFGVDKNNVKNFWTNPHTYEENIYLRFFEIGLKSAIRWFDLSQISHSFLDMGKYDSERGQRIRWLSFNFFNTRFSHEIDTNNIKPLSSDEEESNSELSNFLQLADVLAGTIRSSFVPLGTGQKGQKECIESFADIIEKYNNPKTAYNKRSIYWKKFCVNFFPSKNDLTKEEFLSRNIGNILKRGDFYCDRKTYIQTIAENSNLKFNF